MKHKFDLSVDTDKKTIRVEVDGKTIDLHFDDFPANSKVRSILNKKKFEDFDDYEEDVFLKAVVNLVDSNIKILKLDIITKRKEY